jgi:gas vesicle protein
MNNNYENHRAECVSFSRNFGQKLKFFMIGGSVGAAIALLFAPKPGREFRGDITELASKSYDKTLATANEMKHRTAEFYRTAKETGGEVLHVVAEGMSSVKNEVRSDAAKIGAIVEGSAKVAAGSTKPASVA